jgi:glucosamine--fructose-6-phosphate aminotransferase (isomerizing)
MAAGPERSVAATKTFIASLTVLLRLIARWADKAEMGAACDRLPGRLAQAALLDWSEALAPLTSAHTLVAIGRGPTLAVAREAALKLKETCALHAEAFSSAEFRHGPIALVSSALPVLMLNPTDGAAMGFADLAAELRRAGARVLVAESGGDEPGRLPTLVPDQPDADAVCLIQSFYAFLLRLAQERGTDVDSPRHLQKVTRTR